MASAVQPGECEDRSDPAAGGGKDGSRIKVGGAQAAELRGEVGTPGTLAGMSGGVGAFNDVLGAELEKGERWPGKVLAAAAFIPAGDKVCSCLMTVQWKGSHIPALSLKGIS